ncbi:MAG TPA: hypothetical protein VE224_15480 [Pseudolabrys sp.]|nr:hypothetical protein [Pseudolabrys sp.]
MKMAIALMLVTASPSVAAAQYLFQLRPSPYRILSGWEQSANTYRTQSIDTFTRAAAPVNVQRRIGMDKGPHDGHGAGTGGSAIHVQARHD